MSYTIPETGKAYNSWESAKKDAAKLVMKNNGRKVKVYKDCQPYADFWLDGCQIKYVTPCQPHTMPLPCDTCATAPKKKSAPKKTAPKKKKSAPKRKPAPKPPEPIVKTKRVKVPSPHPLVEPTYKTVKVLVDPVTGKELGPVPRGTPKALPASKAKALPAPKKKPKVVTIPKQNPPLKTEYVVDYPTALPAPKKKALPAPKKKSSETARKRSQKAIAPPKASPKALPAPESPQKAIAPPSVVYIERDGARMRDRSERAISMPRLPAPRAKAPRTVVVNAGSTEEKETKERKIGMPKLNRKGNADDSVDAEWTFVNENPIKQKPIQLPAPKQSQKALPSGQEKMRVVRTGKGKVDGKEVEIEVIR